MKELAKKLIKDSAASLLFRSGALPFVSRIFSSESRNWQILMYHRVTTPKLCGYKLQPGMYVSPVHFAMQMELLSQQANVISLNELVQAVLKQQELPAKTIAITFDDGWRDNFAYAFPVLKRYKLPATIFLATDFIDSDKTFWSDSIPDSICHLRSVSQISSVVSELAALSSSQLTELLTLPELRLVSALDRYINSLKSKSEAERVELASMLASLCAKFNCAVCEESKFLSWDECREMESAEITFGCHTHNHLALNRLTESEIKSELNTSMQKIREQRLTPSSVFCYPEGAYSASSQEVVAQSGFVGALPISRESDLNTSPPLLGRVGIHDDISATPARFAARIWGGGLF